MKKLLLLTLLLLMPGWALADAAGKVIFVSGTVLLAPDQPVQRNMPVNQGDEIVTGADGRVQLLMQDGDRFAIRPNSRFLIRRFDTLDQQQTTPNQQPEGKRVYELIEGGMRTLTDKAWKRNDDNYQVKTPVATIGVRGTDYELYMQDLLQAASSCGLFIAVNLGDIWVRNNAGLTGLSAGQFFCIESADDPGTELMAPPRLFSNAHQPATGPWLGASRSGLDSEGGTYESRRSPNQQSFQTDIDEADPDPPPNNEIPILANTPGGPIDITAGQLPKLNYISTAAGPLGTEQGFTTTSVVPSNTVTRNAQGDLIRYPAAYPASGGVQSAIYDQGSSTNQNQGFDPVTGMRWGRWSGGTATATHAGGTDNIDLNQRSLHWIASPDQAQATVLPMSGVAEYRLVGNTDPTDNNGNVGFMDGTSTMQADFTNQRISTDIGASINGQSWNASDSDGQFGPGGTFAGEFDSVEVNGGQCNPCNGSGDYSGFFTGGDGSGPPPGAGMGYEMQQGGDTVSGAAAFGDPQPPGN